MNRRCRTFASRFSRRYFAPKFWTFAGWAMDACVFYGRCCSTFFFVFRKFTENVRCKKATFLAYLTNNYFPLKNRGCKKLERKALSAKLRNKVVGRAPSYIVNGPSAAENEKKIVEKLPTRMYADVLPFLAMIPSIDPFLAFFGPTCNLNQRQNFLYIHVQATSARSGQKQSVLHSRYYLGGSKYHLKNKMEVKLNVCRNQMHFSS